MKRLRYIDNLRIFLIILVVLHHLLITYGGPGGWYYQEMEIEGARVLPFAMFLATNQSFFMAMFFMISAFFMVPSLQRKGAKKFAGDRLIRLGIPLVVFYFFLNPLTIFFILKLRDGSGEGLFYFLSHPRFYGFGPMWFVEALLIFSLAYVAYRQFIGKKAVGETKRSFPGIMNILFAVFIVGMLTYIVRIWLPVGWSFGPMNFQFPHFVQYIGFFILGILAYERGWFEQVTYKQGLYWFGFSQLLIFIGFPALFIFGGALEHGIEPFMGGWTWQSLGYAMWEQLNGMALIIGLTGIFKKKLNTQNNLAKSMSSDAYTVYILHTPLLVLTTLLLTDIALSPALKFLAVAPVALLFIFLAAGLVRRLPFAKKVL